MTKFDTHTLLKLNSNFNDLKIVKELVYDKCDLNLSNLSISSESQKYGACSFLLDDSKIQLRISKVTPKKTGQFVTIWKRNLDGITEPFNINDNIDFIIIIARSEENFGQFIFPKLVLAENGIITRNEKVGKRGIRVYPPWSLTTNKQAQKTQIWQEKYFLTIKTDGSTNLKLAKLILDKASKK